MAAFHLGELVPKLWYCAMEPSLMLLVTPVTSTQGTLNWDAWLKCSVIFLLWYVKMFAVRKICRQYESLYLSTFPCGINPLIISEKPCEPAGGCHEWIQMMSGENKYFEKMKANIRNVARNRGTSHLKELLHGSEYEASCTWQSLKVKRCLVPFKRCNI